MATGPRLAAGRDDEIAEIQGALLQVHLESVQFHGVNGRRTVPLRKNEAEGSEFTTPEWRAGQAGTGAPVAFVSGDSDVFAQVQLRRTGEMEPSEVEVRADDSAGGGNLLGSAPWQRVPFRAGEATATARLGFRGADLSSVSSHQDRWSWKVRTVNSGAEVPLGCLLYTSPSPRDRTRSRMPSSA